MDGRKSRNNEVATSDLLDMFIAKATAEGKVVMEVKEPFAFAKKIDEFTRFIVDNPSALREDLMYSARLDELLGENNMHILEEVFLIINNSSTKAWQDRLALGTPKEFRQIMPRWIKQLADFSEEYKSSVKFEGHRMNTEDALNIDDHSVRMDAAVNHYSNWLIHNSLVKLASTNPKEFADSVYEIAQIAGDADDQFTLTNVLYLIQNAQLTSPDVNMIINTGAVAKGVDYATRLKILDLKLAMMELGCVIGSTRKRSTLPKAIQRNYCDISKIAASHGINPAPFAKNNDINGLLIFYLQMWKPL